MSASRTKTIEDAIEDARRGVKSVVICPAHDDKNPSLSIGPGRDQPVLINCQANCDPRDVIDAVGLDWDDVSKPREDMEDRTKVWTPAGDTTANLVYPYYDEQGSLLYEVVRTNLLDGSKRIFQRRPHPQIEGRHEWSLGDVRRVPFNLPRLVETVASGGTVHIAEGEKCVRALERVIPEGDVATCNSGGAGKWLGVFNEHFKPGTKVIIYTDSDDPGRQHARHVRENLTEVGCHVRTVEAPSGMLPGGKAITDVADHLEAGRSLDDLLETTPESEVERARTGVDIMDLVSREREPVRWVIPGTLAANERMLLVGLEGRGKSTLLRQIAAMTAAGLHVWSGRKVEPKRVLYIDAENHPSQVVDSWTNLVGLCARHDAFIDAGMLTVLEEWDAERDLTTKEGRSWAMERVYAYRPDLIIMGPLTNLVSADLSKYDEVHALRKAVNGLRDVCGSAIIMEHHAPLRGTGEKIREVRPYGNGLFLKWPDYGYAMVPTDDDEVYEWRRNRGDRLRGRYWPDGLRQGSQHTNSIEFPWMETTI